MNYLDFELRIGAGNGTEYPITVIHAAAGGEPTLTTTIPVDDEMLRGQLQELADARSAQVMAQRSASHERNLRPAPSASPIFGLTYGLIFGLIFGLIGAFQPGPEELKTRPNQGLWLTIQSALKVGLPVGLVLGLLTGWLSNSWAVGLLVGLPSFAIIAL